MNWIAEVKAKLNIVDFIRSDGIDLKTDGIDRFSGRCPFHNEKTPSFKVSETYQNYKCFGCGESGDVIAFHAKRNVLDYYTSATLLAESLGIKVSVIDNAEADKRKRFFNILSDLEEFYKAKFKELTPSHPAKKEILDRGLEIADDFGYAPSNQIETLNFFSSKQYSEEDLKELGLLTENNGPLFRDRLMFFIRNYMGKTIGFSGRILVKGETAYKYVNSKASIVFDKQIALYNIDEAKNHAKETQNMFVVEGQFDVIAMKQNGYKNVVAISGSAMTTSHAKEIMRSMKNNGRIVLILDGDEAGQKAMKKAFINLPHLHKNLDIINLPDGLDPCDFLKNNKQIPEPKNLLSELFTFIKNEKEFSSLENRIDFIDRLQLEFTQYIKDPLLKEQYLRNGCILAGLNYQNLTILSSKEAKENLVKEEKEKPKKLSEEDNYYLASISCFISNKEHFNYFLNPEYYPQKFRKFIEEINSKIKLPFIPENYSNPKFIKAVAEYNIEKFENYEDAKSQFKMLFIQAEKLSKKTKENELFMSIINNANELPQQELLNLLKNLEKT